MKKYIYGVLLLASIGAASTAFTSNAEKRDCQYGQCAKIKDDGYRCRNCAQEGSIYCWSHNHQ